MVRSWFVEGEFIVEVYLYLVVELRKFRSI